MNKREKLLWYVYSALIVIGLTTAVELLKGGVFKTVNAAPKTYVDQKVKGVYDYVNKEVTEVKKECEDGRIYLQKQMDKKANQETVNLILEELKYSRKASDDNFQRIFEMLNKK